MKNVLFISIDDLMNVVRFRDAYGVPFDTPNIDRLMERGTFFNGAHALAAECNPSRAATLTGQSMFRTHVEQNGQDFFANVDPSTTLPYLFKEGGYHTAAVGKVFHGSMPSDPQSPHAAYLRALFDVLQPTRGETHGGNEGDILGSLEPTRLPERRLADRQAADWAAGYIERHDDGAPWFLAVGFMKPHAAWHVPKQYYDRYDLLEIETPSVPAGGVLATLSPFVRQFFRTQVHKGVVEADVWEEAIQAYMAAVSYADAQVGRLMRALDRSDAWSNTTVVLWSDHGFHLGDQETWGKFTHWEHATNAPLVIVDPDVGRPGTVVQTPVSLLDILPTLVDLTGVDDPVARDGHSLVPLMRDPDADWDHFAGTIMNGSVSLRTARYRYIASLDGSERLYDMRHDPEQRVDLADDRSHADTLRWLRQRAADDIEQLGGKLDLRSRTIRGTAGDDAIMVSTNVEHAIGGDGDDLYLAIRPRAIEETRDGGDDVLRLFAPRRGADIDAHVPWSVELTLIDRTAGGRVRGTTGNDEIVASRKSVHLLGEAGRDKLLGSDDGDVLRGGSGADRLRGRDGHDTLLGGSGADRLVGGDQGDRAVGGGGDDRIEGGNGGDRLAGGSGDDRLAGRNGNDRLAGGGGSDALDGHGGRDRLAGQAGNDTLKGGAGADVFGFRLHGGTDTIVDFKPGKDKVDLTGLDLDGLGDLTRGTTPEGWAVAHIPDADVSIVFRRLQWRDLDPDDFLF
jgi:arylsulfatase A-like enzyme